VPAVRIQVLIGKLSCILPSFGRMFFSWYKYDPLKGYSLLDTIKYLVTAGYRAKQSGKPNQPEKNVLVGLLKADRFIVKLFLISFTTHKLRNQFNSRLVGAGNWFSQFAISSTLRSAKKPSPIEALITGRLKMSHSCPPRLNGVSRAGQ